MIGRMGKWGKFDFFSLRSRLTFGIASISTAGLGSIAIWTSWQMQHILIDSHKQGIDYIAGRLPHDVKLYSEMMPQEAALLKAINNLTTANTYLWIKHPDGTIKVKSATPEYSICSKDICWFNLSDTNATTSRSICSKRTLCVYCVVASYKCRERQ